MPGPLLALAGWELRRLARRGQALRVRLVFLYALLLAFLAFATFRFSPLPLRDVFLTPHTLSLAQSAEFARDVALILLEAQLLAVVAVTPALAASAVAEEKERQTLPLLLVSLLSDRDIVFGKALGRVGFVLATLLAGVPVLTLTMLFGGVSVAFLASAYAVTAGTAVLCAAVGVQCACRAPDLRAAALRAYGWVAVLVGGAFVPPCVLAGPFAVVVAVAQRPLSELEYWGATVGYPLGQSFVAFLFLRNAARNLRLRDATAGPPPLTAFPRPPRAPDPPLLRAEDEVPPDLPPLDAADPVLWKERVAGWRPDWAVPGLFRLAGLLTAAVAVGLFASGAWALVQRTARSLDLAAADRGPFASGGWLLTAAGVFAAGRYLLPAVAGVSGAVAGERFRGTLDPLLATPLDRRQVLRAKVQAHAERGVGFAALAVAAAGAGFMADGGVRLGAAAALLAVAAQALVIALGAWLTVRCASDVRAFRLALPVAVLVTGWPAVGWNLIRGEFAVPPELLFRGLLVAAGLCAGGAAALWWLAGRALARGG